MEQRQRRNGGFGDRRRGEQAAGGAGGRRMRRPARSKTLLRDQPPRPRDEGNGTMHVRRAEK
jgi:hypothetical protein